MNSKILQVRSYNNSGNLTPTECKSKGQMDDQDSWVSSQEDQFRKAPTNSQVYTISKFRQQQRPKNKEVLDEEMESIELNDEIRDQEIYLPRKSESLNIELNFSNLKNKPPAGITRKELFQMKLIQKSPLFMKKINSSMAISMRSSLSSFSISSNPNTPGLPQQRYEDSSRNSFADIKNVAFEDKYLIQEPILGEGCASVVKICELIPEAGGQTQSSMNLRQVAQHKQSTYSPDSIFSLSSEASDFNKVNFGFLEEVKEQQHTLTKQFAVKIIRSQDEEYQRIALREYKLVTQLTHPNIIKMHEAYFNIQRETIYLIMDLVEGVTLRKFIRDFQPSDGNSLGLPEDTCRQIFSQLLNAISYLHSEQVSVCHRDINPNNIMITMTSNGPVLTLIDFNVARKFYDTQTQNKLLMMTNTGTQCFAAPELHNGHSYEQILLCILSDFSEKIDMWGAGAVLYFMIFGQIPFPQTEQFQIQITHVHNRGDALSRAIITADYNHSIEMWNNISLEAQDLIQKLMCVDPIKRLSISEALTHPWLDKLQMQ